MPLRQAAPLVAVLAALLVAVPTAAPVSAAPATPAFRLPADGEVVRGFDPPATPYGAGHRGVDLAAGAGAAVRATGAGTVAFAGAVAGATWVTVDHGAGLVTSYGELRAAAVAAGERVTAGDLLGTLAGHAGAEGHLHWSARRDGAYLDPLLLLGRTWVPTLVGPGGWSAGGIPDVPRYGPWDGRHRFGLVPRSPRARGPGYALAPNPNHVIAIGGLGSRTGEPPLDVTHLGYHPDDVTELSYAGLGRDGDQRPYGPADTWRGVEQAAERLRDQLRGQWDAHPGQAVDLVGHSMGGVVALYYLLALHDPSDPSLPPIGHVATVAAPLEGADLAGAVVAARDDPRAVAALVTVGALVDEVDPMARAVVDLAPGSDVVEAVTDGWRAAQADLAASPLATGTRVLTLGAEADLVVPEHRTDLPGADHVVLPGGHDGVRTTEAVRVVLHDFLADAPVPGGSGGLGALVSHPVGWLQRATVGWLLPG